MSAKHKILVVDDNEDFRFLICRWLRNAGFEVQVARDAFEALSILEADPTFDLTLSDFDMPEASGVDLHASLRKRGLQQPFVLATANATIERFVVDQAGIDGFIVKPFTAETLLRFVRSHLKNSPLPSRDRSHKAS